MFKSLVLVILINSAFFVPKTMLISSGYCWEEERYLSNQEKFDIVALAIINEREPVTPYRVNSFSGRAYLPENIKPYRYADLEEFRILNPNSCELVNWIPGREGKIGLSLPSKQDGRLTALVRIIYIYAFDRRNNDRPIYAERHFGISNCGHLLTPEAVDDLYVSYGH
jgi:hypothetical protein